MAKKLKNIREEIDYTSGLLTRQPHNYLEIFTKIFAILFLAVFPLTIGTGLYTSVTEFKYVMFKVLGICYLIGLIFIMIDYFIMEKNKGVILKADGLLKMNLSQWLMVAFIVWGIICALVSPYSGLWEGQSRFEGVLSLILYSVIFILMSFWGEYSKWYIPCIALSCVIFSIIGFMQYFNNNVFFPEGYSYYTTSFISTLGNVDMVGGFVATMLPALVTGYIFTDNKLKYPIIISAIMLMIVGFRTGVDSMKLGLITAFVVTLPFLFVNKRRIVKTMRALGSLSLGYCLYKFLLRPNMVLFDETYSFSVYTGKMFILSLVLGLALGIGAYFLEKSKFEVKLKPNTIKLAVFIFLVICCIIAVVFIINYTGNVTMITEARDMLTGNLGDYAGNGRGFVWKGCIELIKDSPIFGHGPGSFLEAFDPYNRVEETGVIFDYAHNDFLQVGVCTGIVGLGIYIAFIVTLFIKYIKNVDKCPLLIIFASSVAGYLAHSFFSFSIAIITPMFWVMAGLLDKLVRQIPKEK